ncbi:MAG: hypothetical protein KUG81_03090 [Gammaproteobacteria bacterium]|nr:hypothetical protein [Gammaproteobacteria bacterium]
MMNIKVIPIFEELPDCMKQNSFRAFTHIGSRNVEVYEEAETGGKATKKLIRLLTQ